MKTASLASATAMTLVMTLFVAATSPLLLGEEKKASGEELKNHLTHKDQNHGDALLKMEAKYKGKKGGKSVNKRIRGWFFGGKDYYVHDPFLSAACERTLTPRCNVY